MNKFVIVETYWNDNVPVIFLVEAKSHRDALREHLSECMEFRSDELEKIADAYILTDDREVLYNPNSDEPVITVHLVPEKE